MSEPRELQRWFITDEAAVYLRCSPGHIRQLVHDGRLKAAHTGQGFLFDRYDLDLFVERQKKLHTPYRKGSRPWVAKRHAATRRKKAAR